MQETAVQIEIIIEKHETKKKKKILRFLICLNDYHDLICNKSSCKISDNVGNIILLSGLSKEEKISEFQKHCRDYYQTFLWLHFYLKGLAVLVKEKEEEKNGDNKENDPTRIWRKISNFEDAVDLHYFLMNVLNLITCNGYFYCQCDKYEGPSPEWVGHDKCIFCRMLYDFTDFEKLLDVNQWNIDFLKSYHKELYPYLMEMFLVTQNDWECFLNADYEYIGCDWSTKEKYSVPLVEQIKYCDYLKKLNGQKYFDFFY